MMTASPRGQPSTKLDKRRPRQTPGITIMGTTTEPTSAVGQVPMMNPTAIGAKEWRLEHFFSIGGNLFLMQPCIVKFPDTTVFDGFGLFLHFLFLFYSYFLFLIGLEP